MILCEHSSPSIHCHPLIRGWVTGATGSGEKPQKPSPQRHSPAPSGGSPTWRERSTFFWLRTMALYLDELTFIPPASHSAANHSSACWRSWLEEANSNHIIRKKQRCDPEGSQIRGTEAHPVCENHKHDRWQGEALEESNMHFKRVRLRARNADTAFALVIEGPDSSWKRLWNPIFPQHPLQNPSGNV